MPTGPRISLNPSVTTFLSNLHLMAIEIIAGRLIARFLGFSIYTWTSVIGIVLAGVALGGYVGGRWADRARPHRILAFVLLFAALWCATVPLLNQAVGTGLFYVDLNWPTKVLLHVAVLFLLPSCCLGAVSPVVTKWALEQGLPTGRTVGRMYAWGAVGSITGTFFAGFVLIPMWGTGVIAWGVSAGLAILGISFVGWKRHRVNGTLAVAALIGLGFGTQRWAMASGATFALSPARASPVLYQRESQYSYVAVESLPDAPAVRLLRLDALDHSRIEVGSADLLGPYQHAYIKLYAAVTRLIAGQRPSLRVLCLGGGGYVIPRYVEQRWPGSRIDVAEIDPTVTEAASRAMGLSRRATMRIVHMDARRYVDQLLQHPEGSRGTFDVIYGDTFNDLSVPFHLTTKEFNDKLGRLLSPSGVYCLNVVDALASGRLAGAVLNTLRQTFPHVIVFANEPLRFHQTGRNTFVFVAGFHPIDVETLDAAALSVRQLDPGHLAWLEARAQDMILTDDYAPVESLLAPVTKARGARSSYSRAKAVALVQDAIKQVKSRRLTAAVRTYYSALDLGIDATHPEVAEVIHYNLASLFAWQGKPEAAAAEYRQVLQANPHSADAHLGLAQILAELRQTEEAQRHYEAARQLDAKLVEARAKQLHTLIQGEISE